MRYFFSILLVCFSILASGQKPDSKTLGTAVSDFDKALVNRDSAILKRLLSDDMSYGHSNGWIQMKKDVIGDLYNGKLTYKAINLKSQNVNMEGNTAAVRMNTEVDVLMDGKPLQLKLNVLQVWVWKDKHWQLFARQSVKV